MRTDINHPHAPPRRLRRALLRLLIATAAIAGVAWAPTDILGAAASPSATSVQPGLGKSIAHATDFVGFYRAKVGGVWTKVYCVSPTKRAPSHITLSTVSRLKGVSTTVSRELAETLAAHGNATSSGRAAAVSQALNYEIGNRADVRRRARYLSKSVQSRAMAYVAEAVLLRGSYALQVQLPTAPLPGQKARGRVSLRAAGGGKAATVVLHHSANVATPSTVRTDAHGRGSFGYQTVGGGEVRISAVVSGLAPNTLRASHPAAGTQQMVSASSTVTAHAAASYQGRGSGFAHHYSCSSTCDGHPVTTLTACASASTYRSRVVYHFAGRVRRVVYPASSSRTCKSITATLNDGDRVSAAWQYRTARGWTRPLGAGGSFAVDCPAAPPVAVLMNYDCNSTTVTATLGRFVNGSLLPFHNDTRHRMVLVVVGASTERFTLAPGAAATPQTYSVTCGEHRTISVTPGVQRANGKYNYGHRSYVITP